ncbi:MAG: cellulase family glycosylhydrolase [Anaerolineaceae bacterium]|nr:cellulase family glycosylhydrolase [Anaerolineaceae bacterium]
MIKIKDNWFVDEENRVALLRGVNLGGSSKVPTRPDGSSYRLEGFFNHRDISFVGRPFPLEEADEHYTRLREWGFNCLRFLFTWEAVEHAGPGIYDEEYLDYLYQVVKKAGDYGFTVFMDPHQDVWSRFSGGDGAPGWTLECAGFDIQKFKVTGAAIVHQTHGDPFPKMIWSTNACKLAAATMFTLFFAGNDYAPKTRVEGIPIQEYLQSHFFGSVRKVAEKLKGLDCVIGYDTYNEPQHGYIGLTDLRKRYGDLEMGIFPTPWQSIQLGSGFPQKVEVLRRGVFGAVLEGHVTLNNEQESVWLPGRTCVWRENGVWDIDRNGKPVLLKPDYFHQVKGRPASFVQDHLLAYIRKYIDVIHSVDRDAMIFLESETERAAPVFHEATQHNVVYAPHWYDGVTLIFKRFIPWLGANLFTQQPVFGTRNVNSSYVKQLADVKVQAAQNLGNVPILFGEFGIPFDLDNKKSFKTGDFSDQVKAMDRSMQAMDANLLNYTLWNYTSDNTNKRGDRWNDEDLSIFCRDQQTHPEDINSGGRALEAVIRPYPIKTSGIPLSLKFDYRSGYFKYTFECNPSLTVPTIIFIPKIQYPNGIEPKVTGGKTRFDQEQQILEYWPLEPGVHNVIIEHR